MTTQTSLPLWDDGAWQLLPQMDGNQQADFCVVGLGGSGLTAIMELHEMGRSVIGVDARAVGGGAAGRNGGFLLAGLAAFHHEMKERFGERAVRIYQQTLAEMDRMTAATPAAIHRVGTLRIAATPAELDDCRKQMAVMQSDKLPVQAYDGPEGQGLLFPLDGAFQPLQRCRLLARELVRSGVRLYEQTPVTAIAENGVQTPHGFIKARQIIVAVDGKLELLFPELRGKVRTARLQMLGTAPATDVTFTRPVYRRWGYDYWQQLADGRIALGGGRDVGGDGEWTHDTTTTLPVQNALEQVLREVIHTEAEITHRWAASVSYSHNGLPVIEEVRERVWVIGAYSGTGNVVGALCGRGLARWLVRGKEDLIGDLRG